MKRLLILLVLLFTACSLPIGTQPKRRPACVAGPCHAEERCDALKKNRRTWGAVSSGSAALSAGGALATIPIDGRDAEIAVAVVSVIVSVVGVVAVYYHNNFAAEIADLCVRKPRSR